MEDPNAPTQKAGNRLEEEFLATLAHELRNPLNAILGWATILTRKSDLPEPLMRGLQAIERNSRLQAQMIAELADYAGLAGGNIHLAAETIDPYPIVRAALAAVTAAAQSAGIGIHPSFGDEPLRIEADPARLHQIVHTLLNNAVEFSAAGGEVDVVAGRNGEMFSLMVTDRGRSIDLQFLPAIFERFSRRDATTPRAGGLGLGLAIVKQLTELHRGSVNVRSDGADQGATFVVEIPLTANESLVSLSAGFSRPEPARDGANPGRNSRDSQGSIP